MYYAGIDLHSRNHVVVVITGTGKKVERTRLPNDISHTLGILDQYKEELKSVAVESTYNWYWLVDKLRAAGYPINLAHPAAFERYRGVKYTDDYSDANFLAQHLRRGDLPMGNIMEPELRHLRDLVRKRTMFVQERTKHYLSLQSLISRNSGMPMNMNNLKNLTESDIDEMYSNEHLCLSAKSNIHMINHLNEEIKALEKVILKEARLEEDFKVLLTYPGIGNILAITIMYETGDLSRFRSVGSYASYCRLVPSVRKSNGKGKGRNNGKNGNAYLCWAYIEAATFAVRYCPAAAKYYHRKSAKTNMFVAKKALANKIARTCFHMMKDNAPFDVARAYGPSAAADELDAGVGENPLRPD